MKTYFQLVFISIVFVLCSVQCSTSKDHSYTMHSPSHSVEMKFGVTHFGKPYYTVQYDTTPVIDTSYIGNFEAQQLQLKDGFNIIHHSEREINETWEMPWGEQRNVLNHCNEYTYQLQTNDQKQLNITFRVFDDGLGFRYEIPKQQNIDTLLITDETTEFTLTGNHETWWIPGDWDIYEHLYTHSKFSNIDAISKRNHPSLGQTYIPENAVNTPVTQKTKEGIYLSFHEADLTNYAGMTLKVNPNKNQWVSELVGSERLQGKAKVALPFTTPWRTIQIAKKPGDLLESRLIVNLNDPNELGDVSYFTPMKYNGIWWEMHIGKATWEYKEDPNSIPPHGATTENAKKYIDFAAKNGLQGILIEGWNTGWDKWLSGDREGVFDFITPYPDYNFQEVNNYAKSKGVQLIMHHETSAAPRTYEKQMNAAMDFMIANDIHSVKTGYVGKIIPKGEYHHGQWMVNHYAKVIETAAQKGIAVNAHEPIKDTGKRRTYPNTISREGMRGQEFNAWSSDGGNPPSHIPTVAFTRMLAGPFDFTPGVFDIKLGKYKPNNQVNTTLAQQLGLYVVIYSPIQMVCDLPENYELNGKLHPMFQFIREVGVDWEQSKVLEGEVGEYIVVAREERDTHNWFVGGANAETARNIVVDFSFLPKGKNFTAHMYKDGKEAHWDKNPYAFEIQEMQVNSTTQLPITMASGGGFAISILQ